jgi:hypothetical protein
MFEFVDLRKPFPVVISENTTVQYVIPILEELISTGLERHARVFFLSGYPWNVTLVDALKKLKTEEIQKDARCISCALQLFGQLYHVPDSMVPIIVPCQTFNQLPSTIIEKAKEFQYIEKIISYPIHILNSMSGDVLSYSTFTWKLKSQLSLNDTIESFKEHPNKDLFIKTIDHYLSISYQSTYVWKYLYIIAHELNPESPQVSDHMEIMGSRNMLDAEKERLIVFSKPNVGFWDPTFPSISVADANDIVAGNVNTLFRHMKHFSCNEVNGGSYYGHNNTLPICININDSHNVARYFLTLFGSRLVLDDFMTMTICLISQLCKKWVPDRFITWINIVVWNIGISRWIKIENGELKMDPRFNKRLLDLVVYHHYNINPLLEETVIDAVIQKYGLDKNSESCCICYEDTFPMYQELIGCKSNHWICRTCLDNWPYCDYNPGDQLQSGNHTCPQCREIVYFPFFQSYIVQYMSHLEGTTWGTGKLYICEEPYCDAIVEIDGGCDGTVAPRCSYHQIYPPRECPRCEVMIEKIGGCNHIYCENCNCDFCYICGFVGAKDDVYGHLYADHGENNFPAED